MPFNTKSVELIDKVLVLIKLPWVTTGTCIHTDIPPPPTKKIIRKSSVIWEFNEWIQMMTVYYKMSLFVIEK